MNEQELNYNKEEINEILQKDEIYEKDNIKIKKCTNIENQNYDHLLLTKYNDIYIGCISKDTFKREEYGLNKYKIQENQKTTPFFLGHWKNNQKDGIGFLKINDDILYFGEFKNNQIEGKGALYYRNLKHIYYGYLKNGEFDNGLLINEDKKIIYEGKFLNMQKNDEYGFIHELKNHKLFIGKFENNKPEKGFRILYEETEDSENNFELNLNKFYFFDNNNIEKKYKSNIEYNTEFQDKILNVITPYIIKNIGIKENYEEIKNLIINFENKINQDKYTQIEGRYNPGKTKEQIQGKCEYFFNILIDHFEYFKNEKERENNIEEIKLLFKE